MGDAIVRGARIVARSRGVLPSANTRLGRIDVDRSNPPIGPRWRPPARSLISI